MRDQLESDIILFMKRLFVPLLLLSLLVCPSPAIQHPAYAQAPVWSVYFSPKGGCIEAIVKELDKAQKSVLVQAYSFTSAPIAKALLNAHKRGVKVVVILDKSQSTEKYTNAPFLAKSGVSIKIDSAHAIAHNKIMVIDGEIYHYWELQFYEVCRGKERRKPLGDPG